MAAALTNGWKCVKKYSERALLTSALNPLAVSHWLYFATSRSKSAALPCATAELIAAKRKSGGGS